MASGRAPILLNFAVKVPCPPWVPLSEVEPDVRSILPHRPSGGVRAMSVHPSIAVAVRLLNVRLVSWLFSNSGREVKLSLNILAGSMVLSAVGACPPHDGVR